MAIRKRNRRKRIPEAIQTQLILESRRRCCLCFTLENDLRVKQGQLAHIDKEPDHNVESNLVFLCLNHHDEFDGTTSQSKGISASVVRESKRHLYTVLEPLEGTSSIKKSLEISVHGGFEDLERTLHQRMLRLSQSEIAKITEPSERPSCTNGLAGAYGAVSPELITEPIVNLFASSYRTSRSARRVINRALRISQRIASHQPSNCTLRYEVLPDIRSVGPQSFWHEVLTSVCNHGPQMTASFLAAVADQEMSPDTQDAIATLCSHIGLQLH